MACACEIRLEDEQGWSVEGGVVARDTAFMRAIGEVRRIELKYSRYREDSVITQLNATAGQAEGVSVDDETAALLDFAGTLYDDSRGRFDVTSGVLRHAWDFRSDQLPSAERLDALRANVGWPLVARQGRQVRLTRAGMELDFGGIGKEYAADRAASLLQSLGFHHGFVNLGGDIRVLGPRPDGQPWRFGIQHPRAPQALTARIEVQEGALATSGDYERFLIHDGRRYCHILDARTGWPVQHWQSISVAAPTCVAAGALTTIAMLMGEEALDYLDDQGVAYLAIDQQQHAYARALSLDHAPGLR
jgi:thiamine biosynthesis lipoprotein